MRKAISIGSVIMILAAVVIAGNDPWKAKPYQQWDEKDVRRILGDSPWSKVIQVDATWKNMKDPLADNSPQPPATSTPPPTAKMGQSPPAGANTGGVPAGGAVDSGNPASQASFVVRWVSSRTLQRAAARNAELAGQLK